MAVRNPTSFNQFIDVNELMPREYIQSAESTKIIDDMTFVLDTAKLEISDCLYCKADNGGAFTTVLRYDFQAKNLCATASTQTLWFSPYCWSDVGVTGFTIRATDGANNIDVAVTAIMNPTLHIWRMYQSAAGFDAAGGVINLEIQSKVDAGAGNVYIAGVLVWAGES